MIKTLSNIFKQDKEKFVIPRSVQQVIPIETIWSDGIFKIGRNKFAKTYKFTDINYAVASKVDQETMFLEYMDLLNSFDCGGTTKITINNRRLNKVDFEKAILIPMQEDGLDLYRKEYNNMLLDKATSSNSMVQEKYVTVSCYKKTIEEARTYFARVTTELNSHFARLGSKCAEVNGEDKLRILHDFYRTGEESGFHFDIQESMRKGHSFKDYICPDTFEFEKDYFRMGDRYGRVLFLREYASYIMEAVVTNHPYQIGGNVLNTGLIDNLPSDACVEVPCMINAKGVNPCHVGRLPVQLAAMNQTNINVQLLTIEAARTRDKNYIYQAAMLDPHTAAELNIDDIRSMCDELIEAHGEYMAMYK